MTLSDFLMVFAISAIPSIDRKVLEMTIKQIAQLAGVSVTTVSKIANGKDNNISAETRNRVLALIKEYNYSPYSNIRETRDVRSFIIAVVLRSTETASRFVSGIISGAAKQGYTVILLDSQGNSETQFKNIVKACNARADGIIWEPVGEDLSDCKSYLQEHRIPFIFINSLAVPSLHIDFKKMGYALTDKLIANRHCQVCAFLQRNNMRSALVLEGFRKCLYDNQIPFSDQMVLYDDDPETFSRILTNSITGAVCSHFSSSIKLYEQLEILHYYVPADFSIVSLKNEAREEISYPRISCIRIPYKAFGISIANQIIDLCEKKDDTGSYTPVSEVNFDTSDSVAAPPSLKADGIVVIGSINRDETFRVSSLPQLGKTTVVHSSILAIGGKGANQAVGSARLGSPVSLIGAVGDDTDSAFILNYLEKNHIATYGIRRYDKTVSGRALIFTEDNGESAITVQPGANANLSCDDLLKSSHFFDSAGYCLISSEIPEKTVISAASIAKEHDVITMLKPAAMRQFPAELYHLIDYFIPNRKESSLLCPDYATVEEQANYFFQMGIPNIIITLGHSGCYLKTAYTAKYFPSSSFHAVDTTGGADAFISAFACYLSRKYSVEKAIRIAAYAAGFCISRQGVCDALIDRASLETYIQRNEPDLLGL